MAQTRIAFSPCVFELMSKYDSETIEMAHFNHLIDLLEYTSKLNVEFDLYDGAPYYPDATKRPPITRYHFHKISFSQLYAKIQKKISYDKFVQLDKYEMSQITTDYSFPDESETKESFLRYITFLIQNSLEYLLFIGEPNKNKPRPMIFQLPDNSISECMPIFDPRIDCSGQLPAVLPLINQNAAFPNSEFCSELNRSFIKERDCGDRKSIIRVYGNEAAMRNGYAFDQHLSMLNSKKQGNTRTVYRKLIGPKEIYLSIDYESGGFEVFDHTGTHLGQFSFDGMQVKNADPKTHKLYFS